MSRTPWTRKQHGYTAHVWWDSLYGWVWEMDSQGGLTFDDELSPAEPLTRDEAIAAAEGALAIALRIREDDDA